MEERNKRVYKYGSGEYATVRSTGPVDITNKEGVIISRSFKPSYGIMVNGKIHSVLENQLRPKEIEAKSSWRFNVGDTVRVRDDCSYVYASISNCKGTIIKRLSDRKYVVNIATAHYHIQEDNLVLICEKDDESFKKADVVTVLTEANRTAIIENTYMDLYGRPMYKIRMMDNINEVFVCKANKLRHLKQPLSIGDTVSKIGNSERKGVIEHIYKDRWGFTNYVVVLNKASNGVKRAVYPREQLERITRCM